MILKFNYSRDLSLQSLSLLKVFEKNLLICRIRLFIKRNFFFVHDLNTQFAMFQEY